MEGCEPGLFERLYVLVLDCKFALVSREINKASRKKKELDVQVKAELWLLVCSLPWL